MTTKNFASDVIAKTDSLVHELAAISGRAIALTVAGPAGQTRIFQASGKGATINIKLDLQDLLLAERVETYEDERTKGGDWLRGGRDAKFLESVSILDDNDCPSHEIKHK